MGWNMTSDIFGIDGIYVVPSGLEMGGAFRWLKPPAIPHFPFGESAMTSSDPQFSKKFDLATQSNKNGAGTGVRSPAMYPGF